MTFRGKRLMAKQFMTFSVSVKHKKDKKLLLHIDSIFLTKVTKRVYIHILFVVTQSSMQRQQRQTETNITFSTERLFKFYCHDAHN